MTSHEQHTHRILAELEADQDVSQRSLSRNLGIALGLTNLLIKKVVRKGWVRAIQIKPNRVRYLLTPTGIAEKARMSRDALHHSVQFYVEARDRIRERFVRLSAECPVSPADGGQKRIVFYGAGEVAEIGYVCLHGTDLCLVGVVDETPRDRFFELPVHPVDRLEPQSLDGIAYGRLVVMSFRNIEEILGRLERRGFSRGRPFLL